MAKKGRYVYDWPRPMVTVDAAVFRFARGKAWLLLVERKKEPYKGQWAIPGGFVEMDRLRQGFDLPYEALGALFFATPYHHIVESGAGYLATNGSFLVVEQQCDDYLLGYLRQTMQIASGPQPVIAFFLAKEHEIRTVRLILTAKKNQLDTKLILDRIA